MSIVRDKLREKGIKITDDLLSEVEMRWESLNNMKPKHNSDDLSVTDIALQNIPVGDRNE